MQDCEDKRKSKTTSHSKTLITSFTPRQVLLSSKCKSLLSNPTTMKQKQDKENNNNNNNNNNKTPIISLTSDNRVLLHKSICQYLELNGFLKTLKKFRSEADVEKDSWKSCLLNLEKMCQEHLQMRDNANDKVPDTKHKDVDVNNVTSVEAVERKKENAAGEGKKSEKTLENDSVNIDKVKSKKKKKSRSNDTADLVNGETHLKDSERQIEDNTSVPSEPVKKSKDKKKKHKHELEPVDKDEKQIKLAAGQTSDKADGECQDEADKEKKASKKRKKSSSDDNGTGEETPFDDPKRRKTDNSDQSNGTEQATKTPMGSVNGVLEKDGVKSQNKDKTKDLNGSTEPRTTANAFRRVKPDEVDFADERLQNNSYWAKDGADSGYGAKAEEVLGQVRGKDFRHEKTKKKRGSYRGGQIDLQSHSVKFNYDDDDDE